MKLKLASALPSAVLDSMQDLRATMSHQAMVLGRLENGLFEVAEMRKQIGKLGRVVKAALEFQEPDEDDEDA